MSSIVAERVVDVSQNLWSRTKGDTTEIGFTNKLLEIVHDCWHVTPASKATISANSPLVTVETHDSQFTVNSPIAGHLIRFNDRAMNFPDKLTEEDVICVLGKKEAKTAQAPIDFNGALAGGFWADDIEATPTPFDRPLTGEAARRLLAMEALAQLQLRQGQRVRVTPRDPSTISAPTGSMWATLPEVLR